MEVVESLLGPEVGVWVAPVPLVQPGGPDGALVPQVQPVGGHDEEAERPEPEIGLRPRRP